MVTYFVVRPGQSGLMCLPRLPCNISGFHDFPAALTTTINSAAQHHPVVSNVKGPTVAGLNENHAAFLVQAIVVALLATIADLALSQ
jgi:hypothetical protein